MLQILLFSPFQPTPGLALWSFIIFILFWFIFGKYAFKPIINALTVRENDIQEALDTAKKAKEEMANLKSENEKLLHEAREERAKLLTEAKDTKNAIIAEARERAKSEANKIVVDARNEIEVQKRAALLEVKDQVGAMALEIAEKVLKRELRGNAEQEQYVSTLIKELNKN